jgi:hypothetical protein
MVSAGIVEDAFNSQFACAIVSYGLSRRISIGGGVEYLSSVVSGNYMPFLNFSMRLASQLLISGSPLIRSFYPWHKIQALSF